MKTTAQVKAEIQAKLKEMSLNARMVSVSTRRGGSEDVFVLQIRDAQVDAEAVKAMAKSFEQIDRDAASGEILGGGNTFVWVKGLNGRML
jgi:hypothetical protein